MVRWKQALQAAAPLIIQPGSKAGLAIACSFAAHGVHQLSGTTTGRRRSAIRLVKGTQPCKISEIWIGTRLILEASPPDQPRITIRVRAPEQRPAPIFRLRFSRA